MLQYHHYIELLDKFYPHTLFSADSHTVTISFLGIHLLSFFFLFCWISQNQSAAGNFRFKEKKPIHDLLVTFLFIALICCYNLYLLVSYHLDHYKYGYYQCIVFDL